METELDRGQWTGVANISLFRQFDFKSFVPPPGCRPLMATARRRRSLVAYFTVFRSVVVVVRHSNPPPPPSAPVAWSLPIYYFSYFPPLSSYCLHFISFLLLSWQIFPFDHRRTTKKGSFCIVIPMAKTRR